MATQRQSNIELCRIVSIIAVLLVHSTFLSLGYDVSFGVMLLAGFSIIGVNVFVMITGYFSASPKKTSIINLAFICLFWMIIKIAVEYFYQQKIDYKDILFISNSNWFVPSYIILLFFAPILNNYCKIVNNSVLWGGVIALLVLEVWFDWVPPQVKIGILGGYSPIHFIILYILARYIRLFGLPEWFKKYSSIIYLGCSVLIAVLFYAGKHGIPMPFYMYAYNNPIVIVSSVAFFVTFERMNIGSSKFINHIAKSTLSILLGHFSIMFLYKAQFSYIYSHFRGLHLVGYWILSIVIVFCAIIVVDQIRILFYQPIENYFKHWIKKNDLLVE